MKMLICLMTLVASLNAFAQFRTSDSKTFVYDGSQNSIEVILRTEKTHTEYRYEDYTDTCSRTEMAGYRTVCTGGGSMTQCHPGPHGPICRTIPGPRHCYQEPMYRTVYYPCTRTRRIDFQVKDYDVEARVIVDVTKVSPEATPGETINVRLTGETLSYTATGSKKFFIVKKKQDERSFMNGSVKMIDGLLAVELVEAAPVLKAVKMSDIALNGSELNFTVGQAETRANIGFSLKVEHKKLFGSDTVLFDRELAQGEVAVNDTKASVDINKLGVDLESGKYELTAKTFVKVGGQFMNSDQFESLSASKTLVYKIR
ncbi:hypothetical protein [Peredibacter starrii]|uniref:Uncharacterized protein n=1 Tax=Peredibacter starrii TaxID=28202 RepID=A0AAX4HSF5_9BACT|nr:hypothetical protein [Peredibacter starrii]WPU66274.1 hypothetical protein SOO65_05895 [Peredibacter starrii]